MCGWEAFTSTDGLRRFRSAATTRERSREIASICIIHIEKANPEITGLYQMINQQFLIHEFEEAEVVNREDDMGLPGLRQAKMSYAPMDFARKYRVTQLWQKA